MPSWLPPCGTERFLPPTQIFYLCSYLCRRSLFIHFLLCFSLIPFTPTAGSVSVLLATSTLAAGVNLPAGRVIIRSLKIGAESLGVVQYRQMVGRAGRPGFSTPILTPGSAPEPVQGESYLVVSMKEKDTAVALIQQPLPCVLSQIHPKNDGGKGLLKAVLEMYGLSLCSNMEHVRAYVRHTLLWFQARVQSPGNLTISNRSIQLLGNVDSGKEAGIIRNVGSGGGSTVSTGTVDTIDEASAVLAVAREAMGFLVEARALCPYSATAELQEGAGETLRGDTNTSDHKDATQLQDLFKLITVLLSFA
jgi:Helicase conserved C-terminal domain